MKASRLIGAISVAVFSFITLPATAAPVYLTFSSSTNNAQGSLNGDAFTGADWTLEYQIEDTTPDSDANIDAGSYIGALVGADIMLNGTTYALAGGSDTGNLYLNSYPGAYDGVSTNPTSGGYMQFITGYFSTFPVLFADVNDLTTANLGTTLVDSYIGPPYYQSIINFNNLLTAAGDTISIFEQGGIANGDFSVTVASTATLSSVPIPAALPLMGSGLVLLGLLGWRRKRAAAAV